MRLVCISDTHGRHQEVKLPRGDVLVHAGDFTERGEPYEAASFLQWLALQPHRHKVFIAGNHEFYCENYPEEFAKQVAQYSDVHYLCDSGINLEGVSFWGSPFTPRFYDWAFNCDRGPDIQTHWDCIPADTHVLVTHGPPHGVGDTNLRGSHEGCENLRDTVARLSRLRLHVYGHIHFGYGLYASGAHRSINGAVLDERYHTRHEPIVVELPVAAPDGPSKKGSYGFPLTGHRLGSWPRIRDLPAMERDAFKAWLGNASRPIFDGLEPAEQDAYFPWDFEEWMDGIPGPWI